MYTCIVNKIIQLDSEENAIDKQIYKKISERNEIDTQIDREID